MPLTEQAGQEATAAAAVDPAVVAAATVPGATATGTVLSVVVVPPGTSAEADALAAAAKPACPMCKGSGKCPRCDGTGEDAGTNCAKCDGDGECPKCDGSGNADAEKQAATTTARAQTKTPPSKFRTPPKVTVDLGSEVFAASAQVMASTANLDEGTIDVVWYSGAMVPRIDRSTGEPYMLRLAMEGCRMDRLNSGAPVFDTHFTGDDFKSLMAGKVGTRAQVGVVQRAWPNGDKGMATLKFDLGGADGADMFRKASTGILQNLSFGTFIYTREKTDLQAEGMAAGKAPFLNNQQVDMFRATDWEPFEISPCTVPADFNSCFLNAQPNGEMAIFGAPDAAVMEAIRAISPQKEKPAMTETTQQATGADAARVLNDQALAAAREEAVTAERARVSEITSLGVTAGKNGLDLSVTNNCIAKGMSIEQARTEVLAALDAKGNKTVDGKDIVIRTQAGSGGGVDVLQKRLECMQASMLLRADSRFFLTRHPESGAFLTGCGEKQQAEAAEQAKEYRNFKLIDMAKEYLQLRGVDPRGWDTTRIADVALRAPARGAEYFDGGGAESTTDFPAILANVANKTLRQGYESYPRTFEPFSRQMTAQDFKPINRVMLSDAPSLQMLNEKGEYHRAQLTDSNIAYVLNTFGEIVALTRKVIINDDLQAFTRVPALLGVAAARLESDIVWGIIINNPVAKYAGDAANTALFAAAGHNNLLTGVGSSIDPTVGGALALGALGQGRKELRLQKGPQGTPLNLVPRFIAVPTALETYMLQVVYPLDIASSDATKVVPQWVRTLVPIVEPRLDAASSTAWYLFADPAQIDTVEYCYLEGQQGVYIETKQGFEVDGIEIKARMDFGAAAIDYRGMQKNAGA